MADPDDVREPHLRRDDFLGAFAFMEDAEGILFVQNRRIIGGREVLVWDLPGGQVEPGETLREALARELHEELGIAPIGDPQFLFVQEGERVVRGARRYVWRSTFFSVDRFQGLPAARGEVLAARRIPRAALATELTAPYHDSFLEWVARGGTSFFCSWQDR